MSIDFFDLSNQKSQTINYKQLPREMEANNFRSIDHKALRAYIR